MTMTSTLEALNSTTFAVEAIDVDDDVAGLLLSVV
jgi:hypothetical protein